jgi:secretion/DNA translocation related TadE-like protein
MITPKKRAQRHDHGWGAVGDRGRSADGGSGTVLALTLIAAVVLTAAALAATGAAMVVRHRAAAAADAVALTAAHALAAGHGDPCGAARVAATALRTRLVRCRSIGVDVDVVVEAAAPAWLHWSGAARVNARAGPADTYPPKWGRPARAS